MSPSWCIAQTVMNCSLGIGPRGVHRESVPRRNIGLGRGAWGRHPGAGIRAMTLAHQRRGLHAWPSADSVGNRVRPRSQGAFLISEPHQRPDPGCGPGPWALAAVGGGATLPVQSAGPRGVHRESVPWSRYAGDPPPDRRGSGGGGDRRGSRSRGCGSGSRGCGSGSRGCGSRSPGGPGRGAGGFALSAIAVARER